MGRRKITNIFLFLPRVRGFFVQTVAFCRILEYNERGFRGKGCGKIKSRAVRRVGGFMVLNSELRANARKQLGGGIFKTPWLMMLLVGLILSVVSGVSGAVYIGPILLAGAIEYALVRITVKRAVTEQDVDFGDLIVGFKENFGQVFLLGFLKGLFTALWSLLFVIPGIVKFYAYGMATYLQQKEPGKDWKVCLDESQAMMKGHKGQLFCLDLSFIGWYIVGAICFGVGVFFVIPYHAMARANFYLALDAEKNPQTASV